MILEGPTMSERVDQDNDGSRRVAVNDGVRQLLVNVDVVHGDGILGRGYDSCAYVGDCGNCRRYESVYKSYLLMKILYKFVNENTQEKNTRLNVETYVKE
jgi:hypothetical protein